MPDCKKLFKAIEKGKPDKVRELLIGWDKSDLSYGIDFGLGSGSKTILSVLLKCQNKSVVDMILSVGFDIWRYDDRKLAYHTGPHDKQYETLIRILEHSNVTVSRFDENGDIRSKYVADLMSFKDKQTQISEAKRHLETAKKHIQDKPGEIKTLSDELNVLAKKLGMEPPETQEDPDQTLHKKFRMGI